MASRFGSFAVAATVAAFMLAACGGSQPPIGAPGAIPQSAQHKGSESSGDLIYAPSQRTVNVLTYPDGEVVGSATLAYTLFGSCSDTAGNVFVTGGSGQNLYSNVYEFAHGGTVPIATLSDAGEAEDCAVDPKTGNLAVVNLYTPYTISGGLHTDVAIYPGAQAPPTIYTYRLFDAMLSSAYDQDGNLFLSGLCGGLPCFAELPFGASAITYFSISGSIDRYSGPSVRWSGQYLAIIAISSKHKAPTRVYQVKVSGSSGTVVRTSTLKSHAQNHEPNNIFSWIAGSRILVPTKGGIGIWAYPNGGKQKRNLKSVSATSLTISVAPSR